MSPTRHSTGIFVSLFFFPGGDLNKLNELSPSLLLNDGEQHALAHHGHIALTRVGDLHGLHEAPRSSLE